MVTGQVRRLPHIHLYTYQGKCEATLGAVYSSERTLTLASNPPGFEIISTTY